MSDLTIGVVGATGALGKEILSLLDRAPWRPDTVLPYASIRSMTPFVDYGEAQIAVDNVVDADFDAFDAVLLAVPPEVAEPLVDRALEAGVPTVDCSGAAQDAPLVIPWVNPEALVGELRQILRIPTAASVLLASAIGPLVRAGLTGSVTATVFAPASQQGQAGIDELSQQVIALFNQGTPSQKIFPQGLAFDVLPAVGTIRSDGWTEAEHRVRQEVQTLLKSEVPISPTMVHIPLFTGISATVSMRMNPQVPDGLVQRILQDGGVKLTTGQDLRSLPRPRQVAGKGLVHAGRVRFDPETGDLVLWLTMDNLRGSAAVAVSCCASLLRGQISQ